MGTSAVACCFCASPLRMQSAWCLCCQWRFLYEVSYRTALPLLEWHWSRCTMHDLFESVHLSAWTPSSDRSALSLSSLLSIFICRRAEHGSAVIVSKVRRHRPAGALLLQEGKQGRCMVCTSRLGIFAFFAAFGLAARRRARGLASSSASPSTAARFVGLLRPLPIAGVLRQAWKSQPDTSRSTPCMQPQGAHRRCQRRTWAPLQRQPAAH